MCSTMSERVHSMQRPLHIRVGVLGKEVCVYIQVCSDRKKIGREGGRLGILLLAHSSVNKVYV